MSEISSGLVAVAWQVRNGWSSCDLHRTLKSATEDRDMLQKRADLAGNLMAYRVEPLVRLSDAEEIISEKDAEIDRLEREASACDLLEEQKGTITALNMALGGEDSTSTENLIDSQDIDYNEEGLISLCRKLIAENIRLGDKLESTGCSPISEEVEDILRSENQRLKSQNQMLIERVDSWTRDAQTLNRQIEEYRQDSQTTADALGHIQQQFELANQDRDDWIACHAKVFRELQETKALVGKQAERIKELESEIIEQCRINGMGAERELALLGQIERQSAALKLAKDAFSAIDTEAKEFMSYENARNNFSYSVNERRAYERAMINASELTKKALAAIDALKGE